MKETYVRTPQVQDVIKDLKLSIHAWKLLFAIDGEMNLEKLNNVLQMSEDELKNGVQELISSNLIETVEADTVDEKKEEEMVTEEQEVIAEIEPEPEGVPESELEAETSETVEEVVEDEVIEESAELNEEDLEKLLADSEEETQPELAMDAVEGDIMKEGTDGSEEVALDDLVSQIVEQDDELSADEDSDAELEELLAGDNMEKEEAPEELEETEEELEVDLEENELIADLEKDIQDFMLDEDLGVEVDEPEETVLEAEPAVEQKEDVETDLDALDDLDMGDLSAQEESQTPVAEEKPPVIDGDRKTVLVVDDSVVIRKMIEIALENDPFNVVAAPTGKEALTKIDEKEISVIILDLILPDLNGLDVLKAVKASSDIPVIILTGKDAPKEIQKAKEQGADDFLTKPFKDEDLVSKVKELAV